MGSIGLCVTYDLGVNGSGNLILKPLLRTVLGCAALRFQHIEELADELVIPKATLSFAQHGLLCLRCRECRFVRPRSGECVKNIYYLKDPRQDGNVVAVEPVRVPRAIPMLMMMPNDRENLTE